MGTSKHRGHPPARPHPGATAWTRGRQQIGPEGCKHPNDGLVCNTQCEHEGHSFAQAELKPRRVVGAGDVLAHPGVTTLILSRPRAAPLPLAHTNQQESQLPKSDVPKGEKTINSRINSLIFRLSGKILVVSQAGHIRSSVAHGVIRLQTISELQLFNLGFTKT